MPRQPQAARLRPHASVEEREAHVIILLFLLFLLLLLRWGSLLGCRGCTTAAATPAAAAAATPAAEGCTANRHLQARGLPSGGLAKILLGAHRHLQLQKSQPLVRPSCLQITVQHVHQKAAGGRTWYYMRARCLWILKLSQTVLKPS